MEQDLPPRPLAVYLHIPFCLTRCGYCSFFSLPFGKDALQEYLRYLHLEIGLFLQLDPSFSQAETLYFGGGTPSLLSAEEINALCQRFQTVPEAEITLEINPLQITEDYLTKLNTTPVNRLSIGVQSLNDCDLAYLDRRHRSAQISEKIRLCRDFGYHNISLDLIYGLPGSSSASVRENLLNYLELRPEHISCYLLTLDEDSALVQKSGDLASLGLPEDDILADEYYTIRQTLLDKGFEQYEISNFCRPGRASRHNLTYWNSEPWLALGASASGWLPPWRYTNPAALAAYYLQLDRGEVQPGAQNCSLEQQAADYLMMGLRLTEGISLAEYHRRFGSDLRLQKRAQLEKLLALDLLEMTPERLKLRPQAMFISNAVIGELL